jgi:hypothetical protein
MEPADLVRTCAHVYDRGSLLFTTDSEAVKRIHQACCRHDDITARCGLAEAPGRVTKSELGG